MEIYIRANTPIVKTDKMMQDDEEEIIRPTDTSLPTFRLPSSPKTRRINR
jgi:hypothetical protein